MPNQLERENVCSVVVYDRTTNFTELPNRTELEKNYRTELYRTEPLPNHLLYRFQFFHYKKFSLCILARILVSICYKYGYVRSKNHTKFTQLESRLANLKVEEHSKFGHFWKAHDQTNPTRYGTKCNTVTTKIPQ